MAGFDRWVGKVAVVTGASVGIGADIAEELTKRGLLVVGLARRSELIENKAKTLSDAKGKLHAVKCDVSNNEDVVNAFKWVKENVGPVHILVNNAGILQKTTLINGDPAKWKKVFDVNVMGLLACTNEAVKVMQENKIDGHIININSLTGHYDIWFSEINVYTASKRSVTALTETWRKEFNAGGLKIKITSISPSTTKTEIFKTNNFELPQELIGAGADNPILEPEDITEAVIYTLGTKPHVQVHEIIIRPINDQA